MSVLVLGAGGFVGRNLLAALSKSQKKVIAYDRVKTEISSNGDSGRSEFDFVKGDFCNENRWPDLLAGVKVCYHLISTTVPKSSNDDPIVDVTENLIGTLKLLEAAKRTNVRIIFASSGGTVYGPILNDVIDEDHPTNPLCSYGITKLAVEKYLSLYRELHGVQSVVLRIANPYGVGQAADGMQGAIGVFLGRILHGHVVDIWGDGSVVRDYLHISDVVSAMLAAAEYGGKSHVFNIGSGIGFSLNELLEMIEQVTGLHPDVLFHPARGFDVPRNVLCILKAQKELGWKPMVSMDDGLSQTVDWVRKSLDGMLE